MSKLNFTVRAKGGLINGPSHNDGGVPAVNLEKEQVAEVEGGERVFSIDDTNELEERAEEITKALENDDQDTADMLATRLGHRVVEMIAKQERINPS